MSKQKFVRELFECTLTRLSGRVFFDVCHCLLLNPVVFYTRARKRARGATLILAGAVLLTGIGFNLLRPVTTAAATNNTINFQARLMNGSGAIVSDGNYNIEFKLYSASSGGTALWTEDDFNNASHGLQVIDGYFTVNLGSVTSFPNTINWDQQLWLTMNVGGTTTGTPSLDGEMSPRLQVTAVPYAFRAGTLASLAGSNEATLQFASSFGQATSITLPDPGSGTATVCYQSSSACGFVVGSSGNFIQNTSSMQSGANFNISGNGTIGTNLSVTGTVNTNTFTGSSLQFGSSGTATIQPATSQALTITAHAASTWSTDAGNLTIQAASTNILALDTGGAGTVSLGNANATTINIGANDATHAIHIGDGGSAFAQTIAIGSTNSTSSLTLKAGSGGISLNPSGSSNSGVLVKPATSDSTAAFQIQDQSGYQLLNLDSTADASNLVSDGSFEAVGSTGGWAAKNGSGTSALSQTSSQAYLGNGSLQIVTSGTPTNAGVTYNTTLANSIIYTLSFFTKLNSGSMTDLKEGYSNDGTLAGESNTTCSNTPVSTVVTTGWTYVTCTFTTPSSHSGTPYVYISQSGATGHTYFIDAVKLQQSGASSATPYREAGLALNDVINSPTIFKNQSDSTNALQVLQNAGTSVFTVDTLNSQIVLGQPSANTGKILFNSAGGTGIVTLQGPASPTAGNFTLSIPAITANANICTDNSICSGYAPSTGGNYLAKNTADTSSFAVTASNFLYTFTNSSSAVNSGVLQVNNGSNTNSALSVIGSGNPLAGQAFIYVNNSAGTPSGNLVDFRTGGTSEFTVSAGGLATANNGLTVSTGNITATTGDLVLTGGNISTAGTQRLTNAGVLNNITGYTQTSGTHSITSSNTSGTVFSVSDSSLNTNGAILGQLNFTNNNTSSTTTTVNGLFIQPTGTANGTANSNFLNAINLNSVSAVSNNAYYGLNVGTGYTDILRYNGAQLISGTGLLQNAAIGSSVNYSNLTQVGTLSGGAITSGFGNISTANTIATTGALNGGTLNIASSNLTVNASGNLNTAGTVTVGTLGSGGSAVLCSSSGQISSCGSSAGNGSYIYNTTSVQTANFNVQAASSGTVAGVLRAASSGTGDILDLRDGSNNLVGSFSSSGAFIVNPASGFSGNLINLELNGTSEFSVTQAGNTTVGGNLTFGQASTVSTSSGLLTVQSATGTVSLGTSTALSASGALTVVAGGTNQNLTLSSSGTGSIIVKPGSNSTSVFQIQNAAGSSTILDTDTSNSRVGIGTTSPTTQLDVEQTSTSTSGLTETTNNLTINPSSALGTYTSYAANLGQINTSSANANGFGLLYGLQGDAYNNATTGTTGYLIGVGGLADNTNTGNTGYAVGLYGIIENSGSGNIANAYTFLSQPPTVSAGSVTNAYGFYINAQKVTGVTTGYGVYQAGSSDINNFAGKTAIGSTAAPNRTLDVTGTFGGSEYDESDNDGGATTHNIANQPDLVYDLTSNTTTLNSSSYTSTYNVQTTSLPTTNGTVAFFTISCLNSGNLQLGGTHTCLVQINGTTIATATGTTGATATRSFTMVLIGGTWRVVGEGPITSAPGSATSTVNTADYAEYIHYSGDVQPQPGDVLSIGTDGVSAQDSSSPYQISLLGVVSTSPYEVGGQDDGHSVILALAGRVPVNVSLENGPIQAGDPLTSSSTPGVAMKATAGGRIIGYALEGYDGTQQGNQIMMQLQPGYDNPAPANTIQGGQTVAGDLTIAGNALVSGNLTVSGSTSLADLSVSGSTLLGNLNVHGNTSLSELTVGGDANLANLAVSGSSSLADLTVSGTANFANLNVSGAANLSNLTVSGTVTTANLNVTGSAALASLKVTGTTEFDSNLDLGATPMNNNQPVSGDNPAPNPAAIGQSQNAITKKFVASQVIDDGDVVIVDPAHDGQVTTTNSPNDTRVVGVAITSASKAGDVVRVAISGTVQVKVSDNSISGGDLLTSSSQDGLAGKASPPTTGSLIGKALGKVDSTTNLVWVLISLQ